MDYRDKHFLTIKITQIGEDHKFNMICHTHKVTQ